MEKKLIKNTFILILLGLLISCNLETEKNSQTTIKKYTPDIQWKLDTYAPQYDSYTTQKDQYLYFIEVYGNSDGKICYGISKVDLNNGKEIWSSEPFVITESYSLFMNTPIVCGDYVFLQGGDNTTIYCFSNNTGKILARLTIGKTEEERIINSIKTRTLCSINDKYLIWSNGNKTAKDTYITLSNGDSIEVNYGDYDFGILKIDISDIDFSVSPEEKQYVEIKTLLKLPFTSDDSTNKRIGTHFISNENIVYYQTEYSGIYHKSCFGAVDIETGELKWEHESEDMQGSGLDALVLIDDSDNKINKRLYSFEFYVGCYDAATGNTVWEKVQTEEELKTEQCYGGLLFNPGPTYSDGYFYYTTWEYNDGTGKNESVISNVKCINAKTGKFVWGYCTPTPLATKPVVANGKVFVTTDGYGLYVFNAKTGELIGVDDTVITGHYEKNAYWNGNVIYFDFSNGYGTLYAIKP